ncbi:hypothetical protein BB558_007391, partial [Smittium angustum]
MTKYGSLIPCEIQVCLNHGIHLAICENLYPKEFLSNVGSQISTPMYNNIENITETDIKNFENNSDDSDDIKDIDNIPSNSERLEDIIEDSKDFNNKIFGKIRNTSDIQIEQGTSQTFTISQDSTLDKLISSQLEENHNETFNDTTISIEKEINLYLATRKKTDVLKKLYNSLITIQSTSTSSERQSTLSNFSRVMSDNETAIPIPNENAPNWALQILRENNSEDAEIVFFDGGSQDQVQRQSETTLDQSEDKYITERDPLRDLQTYPEILEALPSIKEDFFKLSLTDIQRRRFLASCPRNKDMDYDPPILNKVGLSYNSRRMDSQLNHANSFGRYFSHITQIRVENMYKSMGGQGKAPEVSGNSTKKELIDTKQLLEHATATQAIKKTLGNVRGNSRRGFGYRKFGTEAQGNNIQIQRDRSFQMPQQGQSHTRPKYESTGTTNNNNDSLETVNRQQLDTGNNNKRFQNTFQENTAYKNNKGEEMPHEGRNHGIDKKEGHRRIPRWRTEFLLPSVYYTKEKRGTKTSAKPEASQ